MSKQCDEHSREKCSDEWNKNSGFLRNSWRLSKNKNKCYPGKKPVVKFGFGVNNVETRKVEVKVL